MTNNLPPRFEVDLFAPTTSAEPYELFRELRKAGPVVHFDTHDFLALTRHRDVRAASVDHEAFSSAEGVGLEDFFNAPIRGTVLASDPPEHMILRSVLFEKLSPHAVLGLRAQISKQISELVVAVVAKGEFDGVSELAARIPVEIVADLIGLPKHGRELLLPGADALFRTFGPMTPSLQEKLHAMGDYFAYIGQHTTRDGLTPGSWGAAIFDAVDAGTLREEQAMPLMSAYLVAGMDTTVHSLGFLLKFLASVPGLWERVKRDPSSGRAVFNECLRFESPVQVFFRRARRETTVDGVRIPEGSKVALLYGCANRDELKYGPDADTFRADRNPVDHLAFGYGTHNCAGQGLARVEAQALIEALAAQVERIQLVDEPVLHIHPIVRGYERLHMRVS